MSERSSSPAPTLVSLILCDQVIDDKLTNKKSAIGLFNMIMIGKAPVAIQQMAVLASLTEIVSKVQLELRLIRDADNSALFSTKGYIAAPNPLAVVDLLFNLQGVRFPAAGQYAFEMLHEGELLGRRRFQLVVRPPQQGQRPGPGPGGGRGPGGGSGPPEPSGDRGPAAG